MQGRFRVHAAIDSGKQVASRRRSLVGKASICYGGMTFVCWEARSSLWPPQVLTPRVRLMTVCDGVRESKTEAGVFHVKGLRQRLLAHAFPFVPLRLWLFLIFSSS